MDGERDILETIRGAKDGLAMRELVELYPDVSRRTLQRLIKTLAEAGLVDPVGRGAARRYVASSEGAPPESFDGLQLSSNSGEVLDYVQRPVEQRSPVGYQRDFLESYEPGETYYLSESTRRHLRSTGATGAEELPAGTYGRGILDRLLIDLSWASSHLEGNTYSRLDTVELIEHGRAAQGKDATETQMILNHKAAIELLVDNAETIEFDRYTILNLHAVLSENLLPNPNDEGRLRAHAVGIGSSVYTPLSIPSMLEGLFELLLQKAREIPDPFEQAFFAMVHLPYLRPFADVNKRTSRLAANIPLVKANLAPLTFVDVPQSTYTAAILGVYELTRVELLRDVFVWAYERSQQYAAVTQQLAEPDPLRLAYRNVVKAAVRSVVTAPGRDPAEVIAEHMPEVAEPDREPVSEMIAAELGRLHEGVLARYKLRPSEYHRWRNDHG